MHTCPCFMLCNLMNNILFIYYGYLNDGKS